MNETILLTLLFAAIFSATFFYFRYRHFKNITAGLSLDYSSLVESAGEEKKKLMALLDLLSFPVMIIDRQGLISYVNPEAKKLSEHGTPEGCSYLELFPEPAFVDAVQTLRKDRKCSLIKKEVAFKGSIFILLFSLFGKDEDIFISFKEITYKRELEKVKRELITNMSHELKTPLTAIKGYIETIAEEAPPGQKNYIEIVLKHTERLISIVNDILSLSELEEREETEFSVIDLKGLMEGLFKMFDGKIRNKGLFLNAYIDEESRYIEGDSLKLEEAFINIIDNAIRYTDKGSIEIKTFRTGEFLTITFNDTGIGIPEKSLPRIFERFYVVDKARSKETGGTGLGLSIVKHIITLHKGTVEIKSKIGAGTEVIIILPFQQKSS